jgi:hypothetical protein
MMDIADNNRVKLLEFLRKRIASRPDRTAGSPFGENWDEINSTQPPAFVPVVGVQKPIERSRVLTLMPLSAFGIHWVQCSRGIAAALFMVLPHLVHPDSGVIFGFGFGYLLRPSLAAKPGSRRLSCSRGRAR